MNSLRKFVLVDTDVWVGFTLENDLHHYKACELIEQIREHDYQIVITSAVIGEVATVLSYKDGQSTARKFLDLVVDPYRGGLLYVFIKDKFFQRALEVFDSQEQKGTSYVDCTNVVVMTELNLDLICSFDKVYHRKFGFTNLAYV